jgi:L-rhamnose isomerase
MSEAKTVLVKLRRAIRPGLRAYLPWTSTRKVLRIFQECYDALAASEVRVEALASGFARVLDRSLRIMDGRVDCTAFSHADYIAQVANAMPEDAKAALAAGKP